MLLYFRRYIFIKSKKGILLLKGGNLKKGKGSIEMLVLHILTSGDMYGFDIAQTIYELSGERIRVPEGSLYPSIYKLEEKGYITGEKRQVGKRKIRVYYHIEESGREYLEELIRDYRETNKGIDLILEAIGEA